jgi:hypothetical protein
MVEIQFGGPISSPLAHRWQRNTLKVSMELVQPDKEIQNKDISSQTKQTE